MDATPLGPAAASPPPAAITLSLPEWALDYVDYGRPYAGDHDRMRLAIALARQNVLHRTGGPFAAAVFERATGRLVSIGVNRVEPLSCSSAHAEVLALALAQRRLGRYTLHAPELPAHEIASSCAPCAMCLGAVLWSGARRLLWGALREDALAIGFDEGPVFPASLDYLRERGIELVPGVLREEAREVFSLYAEMGGRIYNA